MCFGPLLLWSLEWCGVFVVGVAMHVVTYVVMVVIHMVVLHIWQIMGSALSGECCIQPGIKAASRHIVVYKRGLLTLHATDTPTPQLVHLMTNCFCCGSRSACICWVLLCWHCTMHPNCVGCYARSKVTNMQALRSECAVLQLAMHMPRCVLVF